ncbi:MAG: hypothetical protein RLZZ68_865 [Bacteroidota bacterium]|nr:chalcone isomerase [Flavobacteriia bacterium]
MKTIALFTFALVLSTMSWSQTKKTKTYHGVEFFTETTINETPVVINGAGVRTKYFMNMYVGALYLKKKSKEASTIINADEEMGIHIRLVSSMVTRERFKESVTEGFKNASSGKATADEQKKFMSYLSEEFKDQDKIYLDYVPKVGTKIYKNSELKGTIPGLEFKKALFAIWLGSNPAQESLKNDMLGKE